jgi:fatty acid desaturase
LSFHLTKHHTNKGNGERDNKAGARETRTDKHKEDRGNKWLWNALFKFLREKRKFVSGGFI